MFIGANMKTTSGKHVIEHQVRHLGPWFHNLHLPEGIQTAPDHRLGDFPAWKWDLIQSHLPADLTGWQALDVGCNAGFYSFELARRGSHVTGIDVDSRYLRQARWAAKQFHLQPRVRFKTMEVYDLAVTKASYDLTLFMGVFYHLRYPLLGLDIVAQKTKRLMIFQSLTIPGDERYEGELDLSFENRDPLNHPGWPKMAFIEHYFAGDPTNWWIPNHAGIVAMLRSAGLRIIARPGHELYICEPDPSRSDSNRSHGSCGSKWPTIEQYSMTMRRLSS
jgi:tRNA (mo5U34)-methyltransferase